MSYPHAETGGVKEGFTMARNRDYDDGDFDQPKRSSPYQDMDGDEYDDKIIAIPLQDPTWNYYKDVNQLPPHILNEIANFFEVYKSLEHKSTTLSNTLGCEAALQIIRDTIHTYECHFCGRME